jgi:hypothetical protein
VGAGWSLLLYPNGWPDWGYGALDVIWLLGLVLPVAWWAPSLRWLIAESALLLSGALALPFLTPLLPTRALESSAILLGLTLGYAARARVARHLRRRESAATRA